MPADLTLGMSPWSSGAADVHTPLSGGHIIFMMMIMRIITIKTPIMCVSFQSLRIGIPRLLPGEECGIRGRLRC